MRDALEQLFQSIQASTPKHLVYLTYLERVEDALKAVGAVHPEAVIGAIKDQAVPIAEGVAA